jgi:hypothetical protein
MARSFSNPSIAFATGQHRGILPTAMTAIHLDLPEIVSTAVKVEDAQVLCRVYSVSQQVEHVEPVLERLKLAAITRLTGEPGEWIGPFQICTMLLKPNL